MGTVRTRMVARVANTTRMASTGRDEHERQHEHQHEHQHKEEHEHSPTPLSVAQHTKHTHETIRTYTRGPVIHSSQLHRLPAGLLRGKRVAVIGSGASAVEAVDTVLGRTCGEGEGKKGTGKGEGGRRGVLR